MGGKMNKANREYRQQGFTLIEVMIAMVILGIGIFAIAGLQTRNMMYNSGSKKQTEGYTWAMDQIERLYALPYSDVALQVNNGDPAVIGDGYTAARGSYVVEWDVVDNGSGGLGNLDNSKRVYVSVRWNAREVAQVDFTRVESSF